MNVHKKGGKTKPPQIIKEKQEPDEFNNTEREKRKRKKHHCPICSCEFDAPSKLKRHVKVHILNFMKQKTADPEDDEECKKFICKFCQSEFEEVQDFLAHLKTHNINLDLESLGPLQCTICCQKFNTETALERHQIVHTPLIDECKIQRTEPHNFICIICSFQVADDYNEMIAHMRNHRSEAENNIISCKLCSKNFSSLKNIIRHAQTHEENSTHQCVKCNRKYGYGDAFIDHMLIHQGMKPFSCKFFRPFIDTKFYLIFLYRRQSMQ